MRPVLFELGGVAVPAYGVFVTLGLLAGWVVRRREVTRLGYGADPRHAWIGLAALLGAVVGSKLGMLMYTSDPGALWRAAGTLDFTGKTVVGGIAGGWAGVEVTKLALGLRRSTGDAFAVALPLAQGIGRVGCFLHGCCAGMPWAGPLAIGGRLPVQLVEATLDLGLAAALWAARERPRPAGRLFRAAVGGYAAIRFLLEFVRGDRGLAVGPLSAVQIVCLVAVVGCGWSVARPGPAAAMTPR